MTSSAKFATKNKYNPTGLHLSGFLFDRTNKNYAKRNEKRPERQTLWSNFFIFKDNGDGENKSACRGPVGQDTPSN